MLVQVGFCSTLVTGQLLRLMNQLLPYGNRLSPLAQGVETLLFGFRDSGLNPHE